MTTVPSLTTHPAGPSLARLTLVELRKMTDTRAGRWLLIVIAISMFAMLPVIYFGAEAGERTAEEMLGAAQTGIAVLLPIVGILAVTGEWSQRTVLTTFALVPRRERIVAGKVLAGAALAVVAAATGTAVAVAGHLFGGLLDRADGDPLPAAGLVGGMLASAVIYVLIGVAFGMIFMNSPLAIVLYFLIPTIWSVLGETVGRLKTPAEWLDTTKSLAPLTERGLDHAEWGKVSASLALWLCVPLIAGLLRLARREVK